MSTEEKKIIASGACESGVKWELDEDGTLNISGVGELNQNCSSKWKRFKDKINKVIIEDGITKIGEGVFENFTIESIAIPTSVTHIKDDAFCNCIYRKSRINQIARSLPINILGQLQPRIPLMPLEDEFFEIHYNGTKAEWDKIDKGICDCDIVVHCIDGDVTY